MSKEPLFYRTVRPLIVLFVKLYRPTIIGKENIPAYEGVVLAGNHTNYLDTVLLISSTKRTVHYLAKEELHKSKIGFLFKAMATIPVNRKKKDPNALKQAYKVLNDNGVIGIHPEGTINRTDDIILPFKYGAVSMAEKTNSYIVPFSITGKYKIFRKSVTICFGEKYKVNKELKEEKEILEEKVKALILKNRKKENK